MIFYHLSLLLMTKEQTKLVELYQQMADLTRPLCGLCRRPNSCCSKEHCEQAKLFAKEFWGIDLVEPDKKLRPDVPYLGLEGCIVAPHLRPCCTVHHCQIYSLGFFIDQPQLTLDYFKLRAEIDDNEFLHSTP